MTVVEWRVDVGDDQTTALYEAGDRAQHAVFVCAHGAGGNMRDRGMERVANTLRGAGMSVVRFNFLYREKKSGRPDAMPALQECTKAVVERTRRELHPHAVIIGGRSMGGRAASMLAAEAFPCDGLLLLAYPLHPAGQPEKLRDGHLPSIRVPVLCFSGTRDPMCRPDLMNAALRSVTAPWTMHWLEGADHSFHVLKSSGRTDDDVFEEVSGAAAPWIREVASQRPQAKPGGIPKDGTIQKR